MAGRTQEIADCGSPHSRPRAGAEGYAFNLTRYITNTSTIRVRTLEAFGYAPSYAWIDRHVKARQAEREAAREVLRDVDGQIASSAAEPVRTAPEPAKPAAESRPVLDAPLPAKSKALWPQWYRPPVWHLGKRGNDLIASVGSDFGFSLDEMKGDGRNDLLIHARAVVVQVLRRRGASYPLIGKLLGGRDHSTIINAARKFDIYRRANPLVGESFRRHMADGRAF